MGSPTILAGNVILNRSDFLDSFGVMDWSLAPAPEGGQADLLNSL
jgi:hypothetical protein